MTAKVYHYTVKDTGVELLIKKLSPLFLSDAQVAYAKKNPKPEPPMQEVDYGDGPKQEPNPTHPEYLKEVAEWNEGLQEFQRQMLIDLGVGIELTTEMKSEIQEKRDWWKRMFEEDIPLSDKSVYVNYIAFGSPNDVQELVEAVIGRIAPTEKQIQDAEATFPG